MANYEDRKTARRESRLRDAAGASADTTAAYYGAGRRYFFLNYILHRPEGFAAGAKY